MNFAVNNYVLINVCYVMLCNQLLCLCKCMLLIFSVGSVRFSSVLFSSVFIDLKYFNSESFALVALHAFGHYTFTRLQFWLLPLVGLISSCRNGVVGVSILSQIDRPPDGEKFLDILKNQRQSEQSLITLNLFLLLCSSLPVNAVLSVMSLYKHHIHSFLANLVAWTKTVLSRLFI